MASASQTQLEQSLFIVTPNTIRCRSSVINKTLFECDAADGIVNARVSRDNSSLFVVADSQVVVLCDAARDSRKYKLNKGDVRRQRVSRRDYRLLTRSLGRSAASPVLARFAYPILYNDVEPLSAGVLYHKRRDAAFAAAASLSTKRYCAIEHRDATAISIAFAPNDIHPGQAVGR
jgi:hypothetical protein